MANKYVSLQERHAERAERITVTARGLRDGATSQQPNLDEIACGCAFSENRSTSLEKCGADASRFRRGLHMSNLDEQIEGYVRRVRELCEHVRGNEQATKQSLIGPFLTLLGYDLTDPRECIPEYRADFGKDRSAKPIDWAFLQKNAFAFFVEAKEAGKKLAGYDEQLGDYFAKDPNVKLGILTNGVQWRFFTDVEHANVMDKEPFAAWDVLSDEKPPLDVITLLQKKQFNAELIRTYAQEKRAQNLLVNELTRLLEPTPEFTKLAVANLETRNLTPPVVGYWKPIVASALGEWAKRRMLKNALISTPSNQNTEEEPRSKVETTPNELHAFALIRRALGRERPVAYEDSVAYFKVHLKEKRTWVMARLQLDRKVPLLWVPLAMEEVSALCGGRTVTTQSGWSLVAMESHSDLKSLADLLRAAYDRTKRVKSGQDESVQEPEQTGT
jgi:hypothetical protein